MPEWLFWLVIVALCVVLVIVLPGWAFLGLACAALYELHLHRRGRR